MGHDKAPFSTGFQAGHASSVRPATARVKNGLAIGKDHCIVDAFTKRKDGPMDDKLVARVLSFRWLIFLVLAVAYCLVYFHRVSLSVVANELQKEFQTSASVIGLLGSWLSLRRFLKDQ